MRNWVRGARESPRGGFYQLSRLPGGKASSKLPHCLNRAVQQRPFCAAVEPVYRKPYPLVVTGKLVPGMSPRGQS